jgi:hypothetical protein
MRRCLASQTVVPPLGVHRRLIQLLDANHGWVEPGDHGRSVPVGDHHAIEIENLRVDGEHGQIPLIAAKKYEEHRVTGMDVQIGVVVQGTARVTDWDALGSANFLDLCVRDGDVRPCTPPRQAVAEDPLVQDRGDVGNVSDVVQLANTGSVHGGTAPTSSRTALSSKNGISIPFPPLEPLRAANANKCSNLLSLCSGKATSRRPYRVHHI